MTANLEKDGVDFLTGILNLNGTRGDMAINPSDALKRQQAGARPAVKPVYEISAKHANEQ